MQLVTIHQPDTPAGAPCAQRVITDSSAMFVRPVAAADSGMEEILRIHQYERQRLGQELHDSAGQLLVSLHLSIAYLRNLRDNDRDRVLDELQDTVKQIDQQMRALAFLHHPAELNGGGLAHALQSFARNFSKRTGIRTRFSSFGDSSTLEKDASVELLRIAQECLVNIHRHSRATIAKVVLRRKLDQVELSVSDNGIGIQDLNSLFEVEGVGIRGIRHRVERLGGRFRVRNLRHGTKFTVITQAV